MMKKKFTTIVLALLMTMMFATAGVFAAPKDNNAEKSNYWEIKATEVTDSSVVLVWNPADDENYKHSKDAVFDIYKVNDEGDKELVAEVVDKESDDKDDQSDVYVFNKDKQAKDDSGKEIPLGYSYKIEELGSDTNYEIIIVKKDDKSSSDAVKFITESKNTEDGENGRSEEIGDPVGKDSKFSTIKTSGNVTSYTLSAGDAIAVTPHTAKIVWRMSHPLQEGDTIYFNGQKATKYTVRSDGRYQIPTSGLRASYRHTYPVKIVDKDGKVVSNVLNISFNAPPYTLSNGDAVAVTAHTAKIVWRMNFPLESGDTIYFNGQKVTKYTIRDDGRYQIPTSGLRASYRHTYPIKVVDKDGKVISNVLNVSFNTPYTLSAGDAIAVTPHTAKIVWRMSHPLQEGDTIYFNGQKVTKYTVRDDGRYQIQTSGLRASYRHTYPIKIVDKDGKVVSNVLNISFNAPPYTLSNGDAVAVTAHTAKIVWRMNFPLESGDTIYFNGQKVTKYTIRDDGRYQIPTSGLRASYRHTYPIKVVDKDGKVISNVLNVSFNTPYTLSAGDAIAVTPHTANIVWRMSHPLQEGDTIYFNGQKVTKYTIRDDGRYQIPTSGLRASYKHTYPIKIVDKDGKVVSNVLNVSFYTPYTLSGGSASSSGSSAVLSWKMSHPLQKNDSIYVNGKKTEPRINKDGTYSVTITGLEPSKVYKIPVKVVGEKGEDVSNVLNITVGEQIRTMQLSITFGEGVTLYNKTDGAGRWFSKGFTTTTIGSDGGPDEGRYHFWCDGKLYYVKWSRISSVKISSSAFDMTYSAAAATNYVNSLNISSSTGILIWVNTYTQKEYIFTGSKNNWRLAYGPWSVATGDPWTPTASGLGHISGKDYYFHNLYYWSTVTTYSFHGKQSSWSLGYPQSNGCVRNSNDHANYIYNNCPVGTAVYIY